MVHCQMNCTGIGGGWYQPKGLVVVVVVLPCEAAGSRRNGGFEPLGCRQRGSGMLPCCQQEELADNGLGWGDSPLTIQFWGHMKSWFASGAPCCNQRS